MGLADDLRSALERVGGCKVARLLRELDHDDAEALESVLALPKEDMPHKEIAQILADHGHKLAASTLGLHRNGGCICDAG